MANEEIKPNHSLGGEYIILKVHGQDGDDVFFRIKRSTRLMKLMNIYCERQSVDHGSFGFFFRCCRIRGEQTPDELALEEGDQIDALKTLRGC